jgi:hypothetical protein
MIFVSRTTVMFVLFSSVAFQMTGCGGEKGDDQNHSMLAAQSDAIVANEAHAVMANALKNVILVKAVPVSTTAKTEPTSKNITPAS